MEIKVLHRYCTHPGALGIWYREHQIHYWKLKKRAARATCFWEWVDTANENLCWQITLHLVKWLDKPKHPKSLSIAASLFIKTNLHQQYFNFYSIPLIISKEALRVSILFAASKKLEQQGGCHIIKPKLLKASEYLPSKRKRNERALLNGYRMHLQNKRTWCISYSKTFIALVDCTSAIPGTFEGKPFTNISLEDFTCSGLELLPGSIQPY